MIDHENFQELLYTGRIFKIYMVFKFSEFVIRSLFLAGGPNLFYETQRAAFDSSILDGFCNFTFTIIWVASWQNLFMAYANNKDADQPAHPCSLISAFIVRCLDSLIPILAISGFKSLASFCSWTDRFEFCLVAKPRRQVFSWRGSFQKYFSRIRTMEEFKWMALCNEGLFRFGWNWDLNVWACGTKSGDLISRLQFVKVTTLAICWFNQLNKIDVKHFNQSFKYLNVKWV